MKNEKELKAYQSEEQLKKIASIIVVLCGIVGIILLLMGIIGSDLSSIILGIGLFFSGFIWFALLNVISNISISLIDINVKLRKIDKSNE